MLKSMNFLREKSRGRVGGGGTSVCSVILRRYSLQEVPWRRIHNAIAKAMSICVAFGNKVMDTRLPQPAGCGDKYDISVWCWGRGVSACSQSGRSMIEMLGVLAIIGVLSVGGIAGYSKAMEKYKINKATEDYSYLIHGLLSNLDEARKQQSSDSVVSLVEYVKAAGIVPETWKEEQIDSRRMSDPYGNIIQFFVRNNNVVMDMFIGSNNTEDGDISSEGFSPKFCNAVMQNVVQPLAPVLHNIWFIMHGNYAGRYYGNDYCGAGSNCIRAMSLEKINSICHQCDNKHSCGIIWEF